MNSPEGEWWVVHAGEYVLGTLEAKERSLFERILRHDPDLRQMVTDWETRLAPLSARVPSREPSRRVWDAIAARVRVEPRPARAALDRSLPDPGRASRSVASRERSDSATVSPRRSSDRAADAPIGGLGGTPLQTPVQTTPIDRGRRRRGGRLASGVAALATAASLLMGALLHQQGKRLEALEGSMLQAEGVSVILGEDGAPLWLVQADFAAERVQVTALAPPPLDGGGDYQLWQVLPDGGGVAAVSLLPGTDGASRVSAVPGLARRFDAFAVSLEPDGGSPEPAPTGTVLYQGDVTYADERPLP